MTITIDVAGCCVRGSSHAPARLPSPVPYTSTCTMQHLADLEVGVGGRTPPPAGIFFVLSFSIQLQLNRPPNTPTPILTPPPPLECTYVPPRWRRARSAPAMPHVGVSGPWSSTHPHCQRVIHLNLQNNKKTTHTHKNTFRSRINCHCNLPYIYVRP